MKQLSINKALAEKERLQSEGYARLGPEFFRSESAGWEAARDDFIRGCAELPADEDQPESRHRRYGRFVLFPDSESLMPLPGIWCSERGYQVAHFYQPPELNQEHGGKQRPLAALTEAQRDSEFLRDAILKCFRLVDWDDHEFPVQVGVHLIKLLAKPASPGPSSPDEIHRDGEPFTAAILISRDGVDGAENLITVPEVANLHPSLVAEGAVKERFTLTRQLEGWIVADDRVAHYVSPVTVAEGYEQGHRTILLIDFAKMVPEILH